MSISRCRASSNAVSIKATSYYAIVPDTATLNAPRPQYREFRNHLFLRRVNAVRLSRLQRAKTAGERAVHCDLADFEARSREALRTGTYFPRTFRSQTNVLVPSASWPVDWLGRGKHERTRLCRRYTYAANTRTVCERVQLQVPRFRTAQKPPRSS